MFFVRLGGQSAGPISGQEDFLAGLRAKARPRSGMVQSPLK